MNRGTSGSLVSVVSAVYNGERYVAEAIASVLAQTGVDLELIVVDDGSTDSTPVILAERRHDPRVKVITQKNRGVAAARNAAMSHATGAFIAFLDADDVWLPEKLQRQLALFSRDPDLVLAFTGYAMTDASLRTRGVVLSGDLRRWLLLEGNGLLLSSSGMARRAALGADLRFHESLSTSADLEFAWRASRRGRVATVSAPLVLYRMHGTQMHRNLDAFERDMNLIYDIVFNGDEAPSAGDRRRGEANMYTRFAVHAVLSRRPGAARRHVRRVLARAPSRLVMLPISGVWRRTLRCALGHLMPPPR